jgi:hypothetical protein
VALVHGLAPAGDTLFYRLGRPETLQIIERRIAAVITAIVSRKKMRITFFIALASFGAVSARLSRKRAAHRRAGS